MKPLTPVERRALRAQAHHQEPVVTIGQHGLTTPVLHEVDLALTKHELVKVRVLGDDRDAREAMLAEICGALECAPVQHLGKLLIVWRPNPEKAKPTHAKKDARRPPKKSGPRAPVDPVRERRRKTGSTTGKGRRGAGRHAPVEPSPAAAPPSSTRRRRTRA